MSKLNSVPNKGYASACKVQSGNWFSVGGGFPPQRTLGDVYTLFVLAIAGVGEGRRVATSI